MIDFRNFLFPKGTSQISKIAGFGGEMRKSMKNKATQNLQFFTLFE